MFSEAQQKIKKERRGEKGQVAQREDLERNGTFSNETNWPPSLQPDRYILRLFIQTQRQRFILRFRELPHGEAQQDAQGQLKKVG